MVSSSKCYTVPVQPNDQARITADAGKQQVNHLERSINKFLPQTGEGA